MFSLKNIFLVDALGASLSSIFLMLILPHIALFKMPDSILYYLGSIACFFFCFSVISHAYIYKRKKQFLGVLIVMNVLYCCLTAIILWFQKDQISVIDWAYFVGEILLILLVVRFEIGVYRSSN